MAMIKQTASLIIPDGESVDMEDVKSWINAVDAGSAGMTDRDIVVAMETDEDTEEPALVAKWTA